MALERQLVAQRVGQQIARHRARLRLTQEEAATKVGVTHRAYQRWESGESMPYPRNVERVAEAFEVDVNELLVEATAPEAADVDQLDRIESKLDALLEWAETGEIEAAEDRLPEQDEAEAAQAGP